MRVFLTGATGFIGSYFLELLLNKKHEVLYLKRKNTDPWRITHIHHYDRFALEGDLDNISDIEKEFSEFNPEIIVHLAWQGVTGKERAKPEQSKNFLRTMNLLKLAAQSGVQSFIGFGSQAEYGNKKGKLDEDTSPNPHCPYGIAKLKTFEEAKEFCNTAKMRFVWPRLFSAYGPKDSPDFLIPMLIEHYMNGRIPKLSPCALLWDCIHVKDVASALLALMEDKNASGVYNLGFGLALPLQDIVLKIRDNINPALESGIGLKPYSENQIMHLEADIKRLQQDTDWKPQIELDQGLDETIHWYKNYFESKVSQ